MLMSCGSSDSFPSFVNPLTSIYESAYFSLFTTVKPPRCIGLFPTCSGVFLVMAASVLALASRMDHHWYLQVGLLSMGCRTVH